MAPFDYKKEYKEFYLLPKTPHIIKVPKMDFEGKGIQIKKVVLTEKPSTDLP